MGWFSKGGIAVAEAQGTSCLLLRRAKSGDVLVDLDHAAFVGFVQVGEAYSFVHEGWWLLGTPEHGAVAVLSGCPMIDLLLRDGALASSANAVTEKFVLDLASRPRALRRAAEGVAMLDEEDVQHLREVGAEMSAAHIKDFPIIL